VDDDKGRASNNRQGEQDFSALVLATHSLVSEGFSFLFLNQNAERKKTTFWIGAVSQAALIVTCTVS